MSTAKKSDINKFQICGIYTHNGEIQICSILLPILGFQESDPNIDKKHSECANLRHT